ncbi:MAG: PAS domain S-box protein [Methanomicrobiales archaeon]
MRFPCEEENNRTRVWPRCPPNTIFVTWDDRIDYLNVSALQLFGAVSPDLVRGRSPFEIFHTDYHANVRERIGELQAESPVPRTDEQVERHDDAVRDVKVAAFPFEDAVGLAI